MSVVIPSLIHHTYFVLALDVDFYLHTKIVKVIFVKNRVLGLTLVG